MITGGTEVAVLWWLFGPLLWDWMPQVVTGVVVVTAVGVLGGQGLINLVGWFASAALPEPGVPLVSEGADPDATVEMETRPVPRQPRTTGTTCVSATDPTVMLRLPDEVLR